MSREKLSPEKGKSPYIIDFRKLTAFFIGNRQNFCIFAIILPYKCKAE